MNEHAIEAADIVAIDVETFGRALTLGGEDSPSTLEEAQYSIRFAWALPGCTALRRCCLCRTLPWSMPPSSSSRAR